MAAAMLFDLRILPSVTTSGRTEGHLPAQPAQTRTCREGSRRRRETNRRGSVRTRCRPRIRRSPQRRAARSANRVLASRAVIDSAMLKTNFLILTLLASKLTFAASVETTQVKTPRGASVNVAINVPDSSVAGKRPAVIIAPGAGYHMDLPIIKDLAEKLAAAGVLAFRFDWNYYATDPAKGSLLRGYRKNWKICNRW